MLQVVLTAEEAKQARDLADVLHDAWMKSGFQGKVLVDLTLPISVVRYAKRKFDHNHALRVEVVVNWEDMTFRFQDPLL